MWWLKMDYHESDYLALATRYRRLFDRFELEQLMKNLTWPEDLHIKNFMMDKLGKNLGPTLRLNPAQVRFYKLNLGLSFDITIYTL